MGKYILASSEVAITGKISYLAGITPIFRTDCAQEWSGDPGNARKFPSAEAAREFAEKWRIDATPKMI